MTNPDQPDRVEHRMERTYEVAATPEEVWDVIATADGISAWMVPTRLDPQVGGAVSFDVGVLVARHRHRLHTREALRVRGTVADHRARPVVGHPDRDGVPHRIGVRRQLRGPRRHECVRKRSGLGERVLRRDDRRRDPDARQPRHLSQTTRGRDGNTDPSSSTQPSTRRLVRSGALAGAVAAVCTTVVAAIASAADVRLEIDAEAIPISAFAWWTIVGAALGVVLARLLRERRRFVVVTTVAVGLSLIPAIAAPDDTATKAVLVGPTSSRRPSSSRPSAGSSLRSRETREDGTEQPNRVARATRARRSAAFWVRSMAWR